MAKDGRIVRNLTLGLTSVLAGMLLASIGKEKVEAKENSNPADKIKDLDAKHVRTSSITKVNKVVVEASSSSNEDYEADPSLKMIGLNGLKKND